MIRLQEIEKHYQRKEGPYDVLRQINLEIAEGGFITIRHRDRSLRDGSIERTQTST